MFRFEEGKIQIQIHTKIGKLQLEQAFHDNFCWDNFCCKLSFRKLLEHFGFHPSRTAWNTCHLERGKPPTVVQWGGPSIFKGSFTTESRQQCDQCGCGMGLFVALVNRVTEVILGERQAGNYPKSYWNPDSGWSRFFCLSQTIFFSIALVPAGFLLFWLF